MLIQESHVDVPTTADGQGTMRKYTKLTQSSPSPAMKSKSCSTQHQPLNLAP
jgi:hypothetical protein